MSLIEGRALAFSPVPGRSSTTSVKLLRLASPTNRIEPLASTPDTGRFSRARYWAFRRSNIYLVHSVRGLSNVVVKGSRKRDCGSCAAHPLDIRSYIVSPRNERLYAGSAGLGACTDTALGSVASLFSQYCETAVGDSGHPCM